MPTNTGPHPPDGITTFSLTVSGMTDMKHHGLETLAPLFFRTSISICSAAAVLVSYRIYSVWKRRGWFGPEDGMAGASLVRVDSSLEAMFMPFAGDLFRNSDTDQTLLTWTGVIVKHEGVEAAC